VISGAIAAAIGAFALAVIEGMRRFYPARRTWLRLRSRNGRRAVWAMRRRMEAAAASRWPRLLAAALFAVIMIWIAFAPVFSKHWYEVVMDALPYVFVGVAMMRAPGTLEAVAARMRRYEEELGEDPDAEDDEDGAGSDEIAL
jgi:hypothetical protein